MFRATLQFDDKDDLQYAIDGVEWAGAYSELREWLRGEEKYAGKDSVTLEELREKMCDIVDGRDLKW